MRGDALLIIGCLATGCYTGQTSTVQPGAQIPIDDEFLSRHLNWTFPAPKSECFDAVVAALEPIGVEQADAEAGQVVSRQHLFAVDTTTQTIRPETRQTVYAADGTTSRTKSQGPTVQVEHGIAHQVVQYWFRVEGGEERCKVSAYEFRVWHQGRPMLTLQQQGIDWAREHLFEPLRRDVESNLASADG